MQRGLYQGVTMRGEAISGLLRKREALIDSLEGFLSEWDAWICPAFPTPAFTHCKPKATIEVDGQPFPMLLANLLHSVIFNVTGHQVVTIPIGRTSQGLPVGVQVIGRRWQEMTVLNTAEQIAACTSGYQCPPGFGVNLFACLIRLFRNYLLKTVLAWTIIPPKPTTKLFVRTCTWSTICFPAT